jgi:GNAT superfamily N-acetyltransferase
MSEACAVDAELERDRPALYMLRSGSGAIAPAAIPPEYEVRPLPTLHWMEARAVAELDGPLTDRAWDDLLSQVLPGGLFVLRDRRSNQLVGTASAVHNPAGSRCYFPAGGQLGYLVVDAAHRGQGLGYALVAAVVERFYAAGYEHLWLGVQGWRLPAIRSYLRAGYRPLLHAPNPDALATRWMSIFATLGLPGDIATWPRSLRSGGGAA